WANNSGNTQESGDKATEASQTSGKETPSGDKLREAFIQSAAIETFFLWDRYKKIKEKERQEELQRQQENGLFVDKSSEPDKLDKDLKKGEVPEEFKRQLFYTLADYRDILFSGSKDAKNGFNYIFSGDKEMKEKEEKIKEAIQKFFEEYGKNQPNNGTPVQTRGNQSPSDDKTPESWWQQHGPAIWNGMICALTYEDNGDKGQTPTQDKDLKEKLLDNNTKKPKNEYQYNTVKLDDTSGDGRTTNDDTKLENFVLRPPYFRYLEEWGQNFCKERKKRLEKIYKDCKVGQGSGKNGQRCSGYGEDCETNLNKPYNILPDLECRTCGEECTKYKKWINTKKTEYENQQKAYTGQKEKCKEESGGGGSGFCVTRGTCNEAKDFLQMLGPCKIENGVGKTDFDDDKTFKHTKDCDPCSEFTVKCSGNNHCDKSKRTNCENKSSIGASDIQNKADCKEVDMRVSDSNTTGFGDLNEACGSADIFKGIRKEEWECGNVCGYVVCIPKNGNGQKDGEKHIITIRALVTHWVHNFLEDYNKIKDRISHCMNNGDGTICISGCKNKCNCVDKWIDQKKGEWPKIRDRYIKQYSDKNMDGVYKVRAILEDLQSQIAVTINKAIKPCSGLTAFEDSSHCNGAPNLENANGQKRDAVDCLLDRLKQKIDKCKQKHAPTSDNSCSTLDNTTPSLEDDDLPLEETEENTVEQPKICPEQAPPKQEEEVEKCEAPTTPKEPAPPAPSDNEVDNTEQNPDTEAETKSEKEVLPAPAPAAPPPPYLSPPLKTALMTSTLAWSVGIGFVALSYWLLK
ncbi:hypothetical protein PFNF135_05487, partial [Plasmodium falciparum NF135/5.C10]